MDVDLTKTDADIAAKLAASNYTDASVIHSGVLAPLMSQDGGPERYGSIFLIMSGLTDDPVQKIDYLLSAVYGFRNGSGSWDARKVRSILDAANDLLPLVPEDIRIELKRRCLYHRGLIQREVYEPRHFLDAAETHEQAAKFTVNPAKRTIEWVVAAVERLHHAIEIGNNDFFAANLTLLGEREESLSLVAANTGDAEAAKWLHADIPAHRFYACCLMGVEYPGSLTDLNSLASLNEPLASQYAVWVDICYGLKHISDIEFQQAYSCAEKVLARGGHPTHVCFGLMIAATAHHDSGQVALARELAHRIVNYPSHGAHFVRAAARRRFLESR